MRLRPTQVIACALCAASVGMGGEPKSEGKPASEQAKPRTAVELVGEFKGAISKMRAFPLSTDNERALHDATLACLWAKDDSASKIVCDSAVTLGVYPLWRALRDFENRFEVMEPEAAKNHLSARAMVIAARLELELRGTYRAAMGGRGEFSIRSAEDRVYYLRGQYWLAYPSALRSEWAAKRLAVIKSALATAALRDMIKDGEEREKLYPGDGCPQMPELKQALRLNELVCKSETPAKAAASMVTVESLSDAKQYQFIAYALQAFYYYVDGEGHDLAMLEMLGGLSIEATKAAKASKDDATRVALEHALKNIEYWQRQYELRRDFLKGIM